MAQAMAVPSWEPLLTLATPPQDETALLDGLPAEWITVDKVPVGERSIDHVVVGPNGVFTVFVERTATPAEPRPDGIYRSGQRVTTPVKDALIASHQLRSAVGPSVFAYPMLVTHLAGERGAQLGRLRVIPAHRIPEAIWNHPGRPLRRSQRIEILWSLRSLV